MSKVLKLTAVIDREGDGHVSTCQELGIVSQGKTVEEARLNLVEAVEGFFEVASPSEIRRRLKFGFSILKVSALLGQKPLTVTLASKAA